MGPPPARRRPRPAAPRRGAGEKQRVEPDDGRIVVIGAALLGEELLDPAMQRGEVVAGAGTVAGQPQAVRQRHLEQVASRMRGQPGLQVGIDAVGELEPGAAMQVATRFGRHDAADDLGLHRVAADQQVAGGLVEQSGEADLEAAAAMQPRRAQQMKQRRERLAVEHGLLEAKLEASSSRLRQLAMQANRLGGQSADPRLADRRRPARRASLALDGDLDRVPAQGVACAMAGLARERLRLHDGIDARLPRLSADQIDEVIGGNDSCHLIHVVIKRTHGDGRKPAACPIDVIARS